MVVQRIVEWCKNMKREKLNEVRKRRIAQLQGNGHENDVRRRYHERRLRDEKEGKIQR